MKSSTSAEKGYPRGSRKDPVVANWHAAEARDEVARELPQLAGQEREKTTQSEATTTTGQLPHRVNQKSLTLDVES
jgi:hypothetical protein